MLGFSRALTQDTSSALHEDGVELGAQLYTSAGRLNGQDCAAIAIYQLPDANGLAVADAVRALMTEVHPRFPEGLDYRISLDTTKAVRAGIDEIVITLAQALGLVIIVVFIFLQSWRATLIPLLAIPVALVGTFAFFPLLGFSINVLSLLGMVLAIGMLVDDAIVIVEAVTVHIEAGLSPREATVKAIEALMSGRGVGARTAAPLPKRAPPTPGKKKTRYFQVR